MRVTAASVGVIVVTEFHTGDGAAPRTCGGVRVGAHRRVGECVELQAVDQLLKLRAQDRLFCECLTVILRVRPRHGIGDGVQLSCARAYTP